MHQENILGPQTITTQTSLRQRERRLHNPHRSHAHTGSDLADKFQGRRIDSASQSQFAGLRGEAGHPGKTLSSHAQGERSPPSERINPAIRLGGCKIQNRRRRPQKAAAGAACLNDVGIYWSLLTQSKANRDLLHQFGSFESSTTAWWPVFLRSDQN